MFQRKMRRFRRRPNDRNRMSHATGSTQTGLRSKSFLNDQTRNNFRQSLSVEKLFEKYNSLAKEAMTTGDKTLAENYFQHADHFIRIIEDRNKNRNQNRLNVVEKTAEEEKNSSNNVDINQNQETKNKN